MGATASSSSPTVTNTKTIVVWINDYSGLTRVQVPLRRPRILDSFFFSDIYWDVTANPMSIKEGLAEGISLAVGVCSELRGRDLALEGIGISIEILDKTDKHTVFRKESHEMTLQGTRRLLLYVGRRSLEASSCVHKDGFTVRCTLSLSKQPATNWWWCPFSKPKEVAVLEPPQDVAMAGSHTLNIDSFSEIKATLINGECTHSTYFAVGGCRWYFTFSPAGYLVMYRASNDDTPTTAEFSFELEGVLNFESEKVTHTFFDENNSRVIYRFSVEPNTSAMHDDHLIVWCRLAVIMVEKLSLSPSAITVEKIPQKLMVDVRGVGEGHAHRMKIKKD